MFTTEQMAAFIVRDVLGNDEIITQQEIFKVAYALGRSKGDHRALALFCEHFLRATKNCSYDFETNGERMVLERLALFRPAVLFDVGANEGEWSNLARALMPGAEIHAFEIVDRTFRILAQNMAADEKMQLNNFGLFAHEGEITMHVYEVSNKLSSHMPYPHGKAEAVACQVRTGDAYMRAKGIAKIDFLKLDVEGAESDVLQGFAAALERGLIDVIQFEYGKVNIMTHFLLRDFYRFFEDRGYAIGKIYPDFVDFRTYELDDEDFLGPNYIACRRQRADILLALGKQPTPSPPAS